MKILMLYKPESELQGSESRLDGSSSWKWSMTVASVTKTRSVLLDYLDLPSGWTHSLTSTLTLRKALCGEHIHHLPVFLVNPSLFSFLALRSNKAWGIQAEPWLRAYGQVCGFIISSGWRAFKAPKRTHPAFNLTNKASLNTMHRPPLSWP